MAENQGSMGRGRCMSVAALSCTALRPTMANLLEINRAVVSMNIVGTSSSHIVKMTSAASVMAHAMSQNDISAAAPGLRRRRLSLS